MKLEQMLEMVSLSQVQELEAAWIVAIEEGMAQEDLGRVLEALVAAGQLNSAETLGWALLEDRGSSLAGEKLLSLAQAVVTAVQVSDELRSQAAQLYRKHYSQHPHFDALLRASGLISGQSPKRAFRTLETCLRLSAEDYLVNRFDHQSVQVRGYQAALGEFEIADAQGQVRRIEPKELADEFERVEKDDFRVLAQHKPEAVRAMLEEDPAGTLKALCIAAGGRIDANALRDKLVPAYLTKDQWSTWWSKARTAAKRNEQLSLEGRPIVVSYHPAGRTLEEEMAAPAAAATMPLERLEVLRRYAREAQGRKLKIDPAFAQPLVNSLAEQAETFRARSPGDALAASLAIAAAANLGLPAPQRAFPTPESILAGAVDPALAVRELSDASLWPAALDALAVRAGAAEHLALLMRTAPAERLDEVAVRLARVAGEAAVAQAVAEAAAQPLERLEINLWLWTGPDTPPAGAPGKVEMLRRLLDLLRQFEKDHDLDRNTLKQIRQRIRSALSAASYASYRAAVAQMDEAVAATIKNLIAQVEDGLAEAVRDNLWTILSESFYALFAKAKVLPWLDETAIWTSEAALRRRQAELKHLADVKMLENARAIGAAAEHGDLSENSEWRFAIEERDLLRAQVAMMQDEIARARIIRAHEIPTNSVGIGSRVRLLRLDTNQPLTLDLLGPWEGDLSRHIYNYLTPLAQVMLGHAPGDTVTLKLGGEEAQYRIESVGSALEERA
jgi:transcription elongation GreA/GreB family factor